MKDWIVQIAHQPLSALLIIVNLILIESLLSVDNAAVLATMVVQLPRAERSKALRYGIFGAYIFRGICLVFAAILIKIWWLKIVGGLYLLYLAWDYWTKKKNDDGQENDAGRKEAWLYQLTIGKLGAFWATVVSVELMDLAFSIDNVFAAVAFSNNLLIILCGVFIGILAMRFVAQGFVRIMERYPFLENAAYLVIGLLGAKLALSVVQRFWPALPISAALNSRMADWLTSAVTIAIFFFPVLTSALFNFPAKKEPEK